MKEIYAMHHTFEELLPVDEKRYDNALDRIRGALGSYENIASQLYAYTDVMISGNAVRHWFTERRVPIQYAVFFKELTFDAVSVFDFYPWLKRSI